MYRAENYLRFQEIALQPTFLLQKDSGKKGAKYSVLINLHL
jgi:hypothetical protein